MKHIALVCKLMPLYRLGVFHELSKREDQYQFICLGDTKKEGGIEIIPWNLANKVNEGGINWIKTSNYFYISERLLWQTGIIKRIIFSKFDYFIFEGGVFHLPTWLFAILCRLRGKKVLFWTHGFKGFDKGIKKLIRIIYFKLANGLLLYGDYSRNLMLQSGFDEKKLFVVYNSLDSDKQFRLLEKTNSHLVLKNKSQIFNDPDLQTIIFIGRLVPAKKISFLLNAVKDFSKTAHSLNCIIIGDGPEMDSIKSFIAFNKLEGNFHLTGALYSEETICEYFQMSDIMISPGNVGLNCMHSLAYGVPVLTHNNLKFHGPEVEAIIPGKTGLLFERNNYTDLLIKIKEWNNLKFTKEEIKKNCQKVITNKYNPVRHAEKIIEAINSL
ncbi:glycosyltransferase [Ginsengibacter hankyongi]|uniref:Glycosyltransferase n=1 Tax=Ginsengibacter hankyongi TaxID=2607284 RepID=A0A5J5IHY7_9BACT|nr:glycosyltransferase [Ginsengibacter hankyongi]KAA9039293.1 glycosyltransferase [Ginsengibacter hankyongi]